MLRPLFILGTRPEVIKLAPVIHECQRRPNRIQCVVCATAQHREMLDVALADFQIQCDLDLNLMRPAQSPIGFLSRCLERLETALPATNADCIIVQGDTTSALSGGLAGFHCQIPVVHIEAGLRTGNLLRPFPEEFNRRALTLASTLHCAPTEAAATTLLREGIAMENVRVTGNTVIDALRWMLTKSCPRQLRVGQHNLFEIGPLVLVTMHRRENFGSGVAQVIEAVATLTERFPEVTFIWPVHRNPEVQEVVQRTLQSRANLLLTGPLAYSVFAPLLARTSVILTDSGGVQEEACYLRIPTVVLRSETERPEAIEADSAVIVGTDTNLIVEMISQRLIAARTQNTSPSEEISCPFGDGHAAEKIVDWISERFDDD